MTRTAWKFPAAAGVSLAALCCGGGAQSGAEERQVNIFVWSAYMPVELLDAFRRQTGIDYRFDLYDSNEALLEKLQSGVADYDMVVPSDYMVQILIAQRLIQPLDRSRISNLGNLEERFLDQPFDPGNRYSLPYLYGTTGIGYNREKVPEPVDSWDVLFDPRFGGRILMLDDMREAFAVALRLDGQSGNDRDPAALRRATERLKAQKPLVKAYNSGDFANILESGDVDLAQGYSGQLAEVVRKNPARFAYVVPREGGTFWMDSVCIPAGARHPAAAHALIDFFYGAEAGAKLVNTVHYASPNRTARAGIDPSILSDTAIYPTDETLGRCHLIEDLGALTTTLDESWTEIKAQ